MAEQLGIKLHIVDIVEVIGQRPISQRKQTRHEKEGWVNRDLRIFIVLFTFALPWSTSEALETFEKFGVITSIGFDQFTVNAQKYRFAPGAKVKSSDPGRVKFSDFKFGDQIWFKGAVLNGVFYVDIIVYETPIDA